jgi:hypothetical protein
MATAFLPDIAALIPLLASVRARKLARQNGGVADQDRAEDATPALATDADLEEIA